MRSLQLPQTKLSEPRKPYLAVTMGKPSYMAMVTNADQRKWRKCRFSAVPKLTVSFVLQVKGPNKQSNWPSETSNTTPVWNSYKGRRRRIMSIFSVTKICKLVLFCLYYVYIYWSAIGRHFWLPAHCWIPFELAKPVYVVFTTASTRLLVGISDFPRIAKFLLNWLNLFMSCSQHLLLSYWSTFPTLRALLNSFSTG